MEQLYGSTGGMHSAFTQQSVTSLLRNSRLHTTLDNRWQGQLHDTRPNLYRTRGGSLTAFNNYRTKYRPNLFSPDPA